MAIKRDSTGKFIKNNKDRHCIDCNKITSRYGKSIRCKSCSNIGNKYNLGKKLSEKTKKKIGDANRGRIISQEQKEKISKRNKELGLCPPKRFWFKKGGHPWNYIDGRSNVLSPARYGDDWERIRLIIYERDNYTCQECGITMNQTKKAHHIHHINPFVESRDNSFNNLITLCPSCHGKIEADLVRERKFGGELKS